MNRENPSEYEGGEVKTNISLFAPSETKLSRTLFQSFLSRETDLLMKGGW
jgi:hypothetical protein